MPALQPERIHILNLQVSESARYAPDFSASFHGVLSSSAGLFHIIYPSPPLWASLLKWMAVFAQDWVGPSVLWTWMVIPSHCWLIAGCLIISLVMGYCEWPGYKNKHELCYVTKYRCGTQRLLENRETAGVTGRGHCRGPASLCVQLLIERWAGRTTAFASC